MTYTTHSTWSPPAPTPYAPTSRSTVATRIVGVLLAPIPAFVAGIAGLSVLRAVQLNGAYGFLCGALAVSVAIGLALGCTHAEPARSWAGAAYSVAIAVWVAVATIGAAIAAFMILWASVPSSC